MTAKTHYFGIILFSAVAVVCCVWMLSSVRVDAVDFDSVDYGGYVNLTEPAAPPTPNVTFDSIGFSGYVDLVDTGFQHSGTVYSSVGYSGYVDLVGNVTGFTNFSSWWEFYKLDHRCDVQPPSDGDVDIGDVSRVYDMIGDDTNYLYDLHYPYPDGDGDVDIGDVSEVYDHIGE